MKRFLVLLAFLLVVPMVSATSIQHENITVELGETDSMTVERVYGDITANRISYLVLGEYSPQDLSVNDSKGELDCEVDVLSDGKEILCTPRKKGDYSVEITFEGDFTSAENGGQVFSYTNRVFVPTDRVSARVFLPEGYGIIESGNAYTPDEAEVGSRGRRIFLRWDSDDVSIGDATTYSVNYEKLGVFESLALRHLTAALALAVVVLALSLVYLRRKYGGEKTIASVFPVLKDDEKEVMRYIIDNEGEVEQREIVANMDYSKAKISRLVSDLEDRSLVRKEKKGRVNVVELAREIGDVEG